MQAALPHRAALLAFLREESEARGCTVIFCTHIFDGLDGWATELAHLDGGRLRRQVATEQLPPGFSLYHTVSTWLQEHAAEVRAFAAAARHPTCDTLAEALVAAKYPSSAHGRDDQSLSAANEAFMKALEAPAVSPPPQAVPLGHASGESDEPAGWATLPKRNRPVSPEVDEAVAPTAPRAQVDRPASLPLGWGDRFATVADGAFGGHTWSSTASTGEGLPEGRLPSVATPTVTTKAEPPLPPPPPAAAAAEAEGPTPPAAPPISVAAAPMPAAAASASTTGGLDALPEAAARLAPVLQSALAALNAKVSACSAAIGQGDPQAAASEAAAIKMLWSQAEKALQLFESAAGGVGSTSEPPRLSPRPPSCGPAPRSSQQMAQGSDNGGTALPMGFGSRQVAVSEDVLARTGAILPPTPLGGSGP